MNLFVDMGANWANTMRLGPELFPGRDSWLTVAFEASPLIQPFLDDYTEFLNGERVDPPTVCLPRSGSTPHLKRYAAAIGCARRNDDAMRRCIWVIMANRLAALKANPDLNSSTLINERLSEAVRVSRETCPLGCRDRFIAIPAAVGHRDGWISMWGSPRQLIRGGAKPASQVPSEKSHLYTVPMIDVIRWLESAAAMAKFVFVKMDVEGAEHEILRHMETSGVHKMIHAIALECHDIAGQCAQTIRRMAQWNVTVINETVYNGMDAITAGETSIPQQCLPKRLRRAGRKRVRRDVCKPAHVTPQTFASCAVVGSAPSLAHLYQGDAIDQHTAVYRTNSHVDISTVGKKTTFRVAANAYQLGKHRTSPARGVLQLLPPNARSLRPGNLVTPQDYVRCVPNATMEKIYDDIGVRFGNTMLSTGAMAIGLALYSCKSVTIYGFGGLQSYDHVLRDKNHDWLKELIWVRELIKGKRVIDGTDRGVHARKCDAFPLVQDALTMLQSGGFATVDRDVAMPVQHLLQEAVDRTSEACPPRVSAIKKWLSGSAVDTSAVDTALMNTYKKKPAQKARFWWF